MDILQNINDEIPDDVHVNLLEKGIIDSFDRVNIVSALEKEFLIEVKAEDVVPENFCNIEVMGNLLKKYQVKE